MVNLLGADKNEISEIVQSLGFPRFRADQLYNWICKGASFDEMSNVPKDLKAKLAENGFTVFMPKIERKLVSKIDGTAKYLFSLKDGELVESVLMKYEHGNTVCVSCQAGCRMGCKFCASTLRGLSRCLDANEILGQVMAISRDCGERISNIVMMGIGEPLDNYDNSIKFLHMANNPDGLNIGFRHISLSTCGVVDKIRKLMGEDLPITLSISLHCIDNEKRKELMPITNKWSVGELLSACRDYFDKTGRRISFEYTLISGQNDSVEQALELSRGLKKALGNMPIHVNLIPLNPVTERGLAVSSKNAVMRFQSTLNENGVNATVRRTLGPDINASCGQLRYNGNKDKEDTN